MYRKGRRVVVKERHWPITEFHTEEEAMLYIYKNAFYHLNIMGFKNSSRIQHVMKNYFTDMGYLEERSDFSLH